MPEGMLKINLTSDVTEMDVLVNCLSAFTIS